MLAYPATREDVAAVIRGMPVRHAADPNGRTYLFKPLMEIPSLLEVMREAIRMVAVILG